MKNWKLSVVLAAVVLAGCAAPPAAPQREAQAAAEPVDCSVSPQPGCRQPPPPSRLDVFAAKAAEQINAAEALRQRAVEAMAALPPAQRINKSETRTRMQEFVLRTGERQSIKVLDAVAIELPFAAKSQYEHKQAMIAIKDIATALADERGAATIRVMVAPVDLRAKRVNLKSGTADTEAGHPVAVRKSADKSVPAGIERFLIQGNPLPGLID